MLTVYVSVRGGGTFLKLTITSTSSTFLTQQLARRLLNLPVSLSLSVATWLYFPVQAAAKSELSGQARLKRKDKIHQGGQGRPYSLWPGGVKHYFGANFNIF